jgi:hypothetical protein
MRDRIQEEEQRSRPINHRSVTQLINLMTGDLFRDFRNLRREQEDVVVPLPAEIITQIPCGKFHNLENANETECSICKSDFEGNDHVMLLSCKHFFHESCIKRWFNQSVKSPICRKDLRE